MTIRETTFRETSLREKTIRESNHPGKDCKQFLVIIMFSLWLFCTGQEIGWQDRLQNDL